VGEFSWVDFRRARQSATTFQKVMYHHRTPRHIEPCQNVIAEEKMVRATFPSLLRPGALWEKGVAFKQWF